MALVIISLHSFKCLLVGFDHFSYYFDVHTSSQRLTDLNSVGAKQKRGCTVLRNPWAACTFVGLALLLEGTIIVNLWLNMTELQPCICRWYMNGHTDSFDCMSFCHPHAGSILNVDSKTSLGYAQTLQDLLLFRFTPIVTPQLAINVVWIQKIEIREICKERFLFF